MKSLVATTSIPRVVSPRASRDVPAGSLSANSFRVLSGGRATGEENERAHYRRGVAGDWRNHFQDEHLNYFERLYDPLHLKLGYESAEDWS